MKNFLRKSLLVLISGGLLLGAFAGSAIAGVFPDVPEDHEYYKAIEYMKGHGYIGGYSDLTFKPDQEINRAEAVKIIVSALNIPHDGEYLVLFGDVPASEWFFEYVMGAHEAGIASGDKNGGFRPGDPINLAESLKIVAEALDLEMPEVGDGSGDGSIFADVSADSWYASYALYAKEKNIVLMDEYGEVHAGDSMTRGRFADVMYRFMRVIEADGQPFPLDESWALHEDSLLPFKVKTPDGWDILSYDNGVDQVVIWQGDAIFYQFSPERVYPNTAKFVVTLDPNTEGLSKNEYFSNVKMVFGSGKTSSAKVGDYDALTVLYDDEYIEDLYIYLVGGKFDGQVLIVYTQNGSGILADQNRKFLDAMLGSFEYFHGALSGGAGGSGGDDYANLKSQIFENVLVEGKGQSMLNLLPDKTIIETDSVGVGTGPIDYYYSSAVDITLKYERASDVILDYREEQTSAF